MYVIPKEKKLKEAKETLEKINQFIQEKTV